MHYEGGFIVLISLVDLEFNSPVNTIKVMMSWSVYLTTLFLGGLFHLSISHTLIIASIQTLSKKLVIRSLLV